MVNRVIDRRGAKGQQMRWSRGPPLAPGPAARAQAGTCRKRSDMGTRALGPLAPTEATAA